MKSLFVSFLLLFSSSLLASSYYTNCYISEGQAIALYCSTTSASGSGTGSIKVYNKYGSQIDSSMSVWVGIAVMGCDEVDSVYVGEDAAFCVFNLMN